MNRNRVIAGALVVTIVTGSVGVSGVKVSAAEKNQQEKEEVIYIMTDANGVVDNVNAVNIFGKGDVTDYGDYSSVKMLNTTEAIHQDGDKVTFSTDKEKVYYQGTMKNVQIPWNISFTYTLDGKEISPEDLAGQSGAFEIHIKIDKNEDCMTDFYDSCALQAAVTLDTERCENIQADGATLANIGSNKQISYTVLPGKGLDAVIKADVTDFAMDAATINGVKLDLDIDIDDEELMEKVTDIMDAAKQLNDGAAELSNGTTELADGSSNLKDGASSLYTGTTSLDSGIDSLSSGVSQMQSALDTLNRQSGTLTSGSSQMLAALQQVQSELSNVAVATDQLKQLTDSSSAIRQGIGNAYAGAAQLSGSLSYDSYKSAMQQGGLDLEQLQAGNSQAASNLSSQISALNASIDQLKSMPDYDSNPAYAQQIQVLEEQISVLNQTVTLLNGNNAAIAGTKQYFNTISGGASDLTAGLEQLNNNYATFDTAIVTLADSISGLTANMTTLRDAINQLVDSYESLDSGIGAYTDGVASIVGAYSQISNGTKTLASGSKELVEGSKRLKDGAVTLDDGVGTLQSGVQKLKDGTQEFYDQTDGMDEKIEDEMNDMIDSLSGGDAQIISFVSDKNENVESVQFVIKTAAIEKEEVQQVTETKTEETGFGQKLLRLFGLDQ